MLMWNTYEIVETDKESINRWANILQGTSEMHQMKKEEEEEEEEWWNDVFALTLFLFFF